MRSRGGHFLTCTIWSDQKTRDGIDQTKNEVRYCQPPYVDHSATQGGLHDSIAHAHNKQQEERERIPGCIQNANYDQEDLRSNVGAVAVQVVCASR